MVQTEVRAAVGVILNIDESDRYCQKYRKIENSESTGQRRYRFFAFAELNVSRVTSMVCMESQIRITRLMARGERMAVRATVRGFFACGRYTAISGRDCTTPRETARAASGCRIETAYYRACCHLLRRYNQQFVTKKLVIGD